MDRKEREKLKRKWRSFDKKLTYECKNRKKGEQARENNFLFQERIHKF